MLLKQLGGKCTYVKRMKKVKEIFSKKVGVQSWEEAEAKFPTYTTNISLEPFLRNTDPSNAALMHHCRKALKSIMTNCESSNYPQVPCNT